MATRKAKTKAALSLSRFSRVIQPSTASGQPIKIARKRNRALPPPPLNSLCHPDHPFLYRHCEELQRRGNLTINPSSHAIGPTKGVMTISH